MLVNALAVAQVGIDAGSAKDVDPIVGCFGTDAVIQDDAGTVVGNGRAAVRAYLNQFIAQSPNLHPEIRFCTQLATWVVQPEHTPGLVLAESVLDLHIVVAYQVEGGKIVRCIE